MVIWLKQLNIYLKKKNHTDMYNKVFWSQRCFLNKCINSEVGGSAAHFNKLKSFCVTWKTKQIRNDYEQITENKLNYNDAN